MNREEDTRANLEQRGISDTNLLKILAWDSSFFGYAVGKIAAKEIRVATINKIIDEARRKDVKLLYLFMNASDKVSQHSAEMVEAKLVDKKVTFSLKIGDAVFERDNHIELLMTGCPSDKLIQLAIQSGLYSRYKNRLQF
jgi:dTDP-4-amino-4,6-dideoxy-D-galactose acyltransferase